ncbi:mannose-1-phosphate guanylyltransferase/mannose-6-phosphate isomerase [Caenispirillum bisanense]|nr:mannose-1-phosphate guanylyltransferase/mannose-6-phosphate isomerase [Caenispirillum bisanense]
MPTAQITPVVLSGGSGSRLWPLSRADYPKQFIPVAGELSLIQQTVLRTVGAGFASPLVVCNEEHRFVVAEQLRAVDVAPRDILLEPVGRNTGPAAAIAALHLQEAGAAAEDLMLVMPSDHVMADVPAFLQAVIAATPAARDGALVTFGVTPDRAETGYGYIEAGDAMSLHPDVCAVARFVEKPEAARAEQFLAGGRHLWNSGIFLFSPQAYLDELEAAAPAVVAACRAALAGSTRDLTFRRLAAEPFTDCPATSIDYAVMERTRRAAVVPLAAGWDDLGAWSALWQLGEKDTAGNVARGDVLLHDTRGAYVRSDRGLVAVAGLTDVVVVATDDAVLVTDRSHAQEVKAVVDRLTAAGRTEATAPSTVHRPWGSYRAIDAGDRFQVKRIVVHPGGRLSLQRHFHRAEHWVVVSGTALVRRGDETFLLRENESTYIPAGTVHRLENPGRIPLHLIEVQSGGYLGEDDIVRLDDGYGRVPSQ